MRQIPDRGDIIHLQFDPASGMEIKGDHFALVVSPKIFNRLGLAFVCPISQGNAQKYRELGLLVTLQGTGTHTQGMIHCHHLKSLDLRSRNVSIKEKVPKYVIDEVINHIQAIILDD